MPFEQFEQLVAQQRRALEAQGQEPPQPGSEAEKTLEYRALVVLVQRTVIALEAEARDIIVADNEITKRINKVIQNQFDGDRASYEESLRRSGATRELARAEVRSQLLFGKLTRDFNKQATVTDAEVRAAYEQRRAEFEQPRSRKVKIILLADEAEARQVKQELDAGADFDTAVRTASLSGGGIYTDTEGSFPAPFEQAAFALTNGEVSEPVQSNGVWYLIKALGPLKGEATIPYAQAEKRLRAELLAQKRSSQAWFPTLMQQYEKTIEYAPDYGPNA